MHAGLDDDRSFAARGLFGQTQAVTDIVADPVENLGRHVVVRQDDGVLGYLQSVDLSDQRSLELPFHRRNVGFHLVPDGLGGALYRRGKRKLRTVGHRDLLMLRMSISRTLNSAFGAREPLDAPVMLKSSKTN